MTTITAALIRRVAIQLHPMGTYLDTTITYIQLLLKTYAEALVLATDLSSIKQWLPIVFPGKLAMEMLNVIMEAVRSQFRKEFGQEMEGQGGYINPAHINILVDTIINNNEDVFNRKDSFVASAKQVIIEHLISTICMKVGINANDQHVLPWDVQEAIVKDKELSTLFGITVQTLPVTIKIGDKDHIHQFTADFTAGLFFSVMNNNDYQITMFGSDVGLNYQSRYHKQVQPVYSIHVKDVKIYFNTPDFIQGFMTGAMWLNVNYQDYLHDLILHQGDTVTPMTF